jgi:hypothetical protein
MEMTSLALNMKTSMTYHVLMQKLAVPQELIDLLHQATLSGTVSVKMSVQKLSMSTGPAVTGPVEEHEFGLGLTVLESITSGKVSITQATYLREGIVSAIKALQSAGLIKQEVTEWVPAELVMTHHDSIATVLSDMHLKQGLLEDAQVVSPKITNGGNPAKTSTWGVFNMNELAATPTVPLREATKLYQPVQGTSGTSRYFAVACHPKLKVAARYGSSSLSIRIEGDALPVMKHTLSDLGFDTVKSAYSSVHLSVDTLLLAQKTLGSILLGLSIPFETVFPDLSIIKDKGK